MKYKIIICAGNSRSGSTKQYNFVKQLLEENNIEFKDYGYQDEIPQGIVSRKNDGQVAIIKCHNPIMEEHKDICYLNIIRCSAGVRSSLIRFSRSSEKRVTEILREDFEKTRQMLNQTNTLVQKFASCDEKMIEELADYLEIPVVSPKLIKSVDFSISKRILKKMLKYNLNKLLPKTLRRKIKLLIKQYDSDTLLHPNHIRKNEYTDLRSQPEICSLCLIEGTCNEYFNSDK